MPLQQSLADARKPYQGTARTLVIAMDVGTVFSAVSYTILEPGEIPKICSVTRFPGQDHHHTAGDRKIPSIIYYNQHGQVMAVGAEARISAIQAKAENENWIKVQFFKLRLRPPTMQINMDGIRLGPLPNRKSPVDVFGDYLAYLYRCTRDFIIDAHADGGTLWNQVESDIQFVLSHPNGWEGAQQSQMRRAAICGSLIPNTTQDKARIRFVSEGEASLHACLLNGLVADILSNPSPERSGFLIVDVGGGTIDMSAYAIKTESSSLAIEEVAVPDCIFAGSVFVSLRAREFLQEKLRDSFYGTPDQLDHIVKCLDDICSRRFIGRRDLNIPFGSPSDNDISVGISDGQLRLTEQEVADLFEPFIDVMVEAIRSQIKASQVAIKFIFLVGGYAASPWLFGQLQRRLARDRVIVSRPDTQPLKAVAEGAIGFYCDHHVSVRMSKFMYGVEFFREMNPEDPDHVLRSERLCETPSGQKFLPDAFDCILSKNVRVKESTVFTRKYSTELTNISLLHLFEVEMWCYRGGDTIPMWIDRQAHDFSILCIVRADLSPLASAVEPKVGKNGKAYWTIVFSVEVLFGLTEFKARIKWFDNGLTRYGPASIIYNERGHRVDEDED